ncbi:MAG: L-fucose/L-arabinose isomerase family protein [Candidatus Hydrogenedentota bacterium]
MNIGLYGIGLDTYWAQFEGLLDRLNGYQDRIAERLQKRFPEANLINTGIVDNPIQAREVGERLARENVDLILLYVSTYALSSTVLPVVQRAKVPVIVLNLQPVSAIDYESFNALGDRGKMTGEWLAHCQACFAPEIACVFNRAGIDYHLVTGTLDDDVAWSEIAGWVQAAQVAVQLRNTRIGVLGHYYCGMLDVYSDMTQLAAVFGSHFELLEMCALRSLREEISPEEITAKRNQFQRDFAVDEACSKEELDRAAHTSVALDNLVKQNDLGCMAYYYEGQPGNEYENVVTSVIAGNTLLTMHGVPVAGECEIKNVIAMKILDLLECGGSFSEFYAMDFDDDIVLLGHDGPAHAAIAAGKVELVPLPVYHGKPGKGLSIQMSVKEGPVTLLAVVQGARGQVSLLTAEGHSVPGPVLRIGNTNSRYRFSISAKDFVNEWSRQGPAHHLAIGTGHIASLLDKLAKLLGIPCHRVC